MLKVIDGDSRLFYAMHAFTQFYRCDDMCEWLIKHNITGKELWDWVQTKHQGSNFNLAKFVLTKVKKEAELQPVIAGIDFITQRNV